MYYLTQSSKINYFKVKNNYTLNYQYIYGRSGIIEISFLDYEKFFSFYYFRVLYTKKNEIKYMPIDSNLGNLCLPKENKIKGNYYCYLILKNNYKELFT